MVFYGKSGFAEEGEVGFGGVGGGALAGGGVGDDNYVSRGYVVWISFLKKTNQGWGVFGVVFGDDVKFGATADDDLGKDCSDVKVATYEESVVHFDGGVAPMDVAVKGVINGGIFEVCKLSL